MSTTKTKGNYLFVSSSSLNVEKFNVLIIGYLYGFINRECSIPQDIIDVIFKFQKAAWDSDLSHQHLDITDGVVIHSDRSNNKYLSSFGVRDMISGKAEWRIKIYKAKEVKIGIIGIKHVSKELNTFCDNATGYGYHSNGKKRNNRKWTDCGPKLVKGDILTITLDMNEYTLSYKHNDKDLGVVFNIDNSTAYRFVVESYCTGDHYEML